MDVFISVGIAMIVLGVASVYLYYNFNKEKEAIIRELERKEGLLSKSGVGMLLTDSKGEVLYLNEKIQKYLTKIDLMMYVGDSVNIMITRFNQYIDSDQALNSEDLICKNGGSEFVVKIKGLLNNIAYYNVTITAYEEDGAYVGQIIEIKDVTEREVAKRIDQAIIKVSMNVLKFKTIEDILKYFSSAMEEIIDIDYVFANVHQEKDESFFINHTEMNYINKVIKSTTVNPLVKYLSEQKGPIYMEESAISTQGIVVAHQGNVLEAKEIIGCPIHCQGNTNMGAIGLVFKEKVTYPQLMKDSLEVITNYIGQVIERLKVADKIHQLAYMDQLTGIANRNMFMKMLEQEIIDVSLSGNKILGLLFLDFSGLKRVNDEYSHYVGDRLLKDIGSGLIKLSEDVFYIGRLGGDEFGIFTACSSKDEIEGVASNILSYIDQPRLIEGNTVQVVGSIGVSIYKEDSIYPEELIYKADKALAVAKSQGKSKYAFFS